jgi:metal-responsive CopG/Arc/MetJ family transcriptional regulator
MQAYFSLGIPLDLLKRLDQIVETRGHKSRNAVVVSLIKTFVQYSDDLAAKEKKPLRKDRTHE